MAETGLQQRRRLIPVLTGPTAAGKTEISLKIAASLDAEIISADSRQVYRELNAGTAKPGPEELAQIPHHFIDERSLGEPFSAGIFAREANARIQDILQRGRTPLVIGGSTLYLYALLHGLADIPDVDTDIRAELQSRLAREGPEALYRILEQVDPVSASSMDSTKTQRLIRALEVYYGTGRPLSSFFPAHTAPPFSFKTVVLNRERGDLYRRINQRVDAMLAAGLVDEVRHLLENGADPAGNALQTIGYREPIRYLRGEISRNEMTGLIKRNTRHYAKRQLTWFRRFPEFSWVDLDDNLGRDVLVDAITDLF